MKKTWLSDLTLKPDNEFFSIITAFGLVERVANNFGEIIPRFINRSRLLQVLLTVLHMVMGNYGQVSLRFLKYLDAVMVVIL